MDLHQGDDTIHRSDREVATHAINDELGQSLATEAGQCLGATLKDTSGADTPGARETRAAAQAVAIALPAIPGGEAKGDGLAADASPPLSAAQLVLARALPKRIHIHIADVSHEPIASALRASYEKQGWIVPLTETVGKNAPNGLQCATSTTATARPRHIRWS